MYMTIRSRMTSIMDLIGPELSKLSALELENLPYFTLFTLIHLQILTNQYQTWPQYMCSQGLGWDRLWVKLNQNTRSYLPLNLEKLLNMTLFTLYQLQIFTNQHQTCSWIRKFAIFDFVYTLAFANIDQSVPNLATVYLPLRSPMSLIIEQIKPEHPELFALEFGKIAESDLVYTLASTNINQSALNLVKMYLTITSRMSLIMD